MAWLVFAVTGVHAQENLVANPGFESVADGGFAADWGQGSFGRIGKTLFMESAGARTGQRCLRMVGTPNTWTTCAADAITVKPEANYWVTWWFKAKQPTTSRTYLFLQTNLGQRVFPHTDQRGDFDWALKIVSYRTTPGETTLQPVLTMQTFQNEVGTSWWDEVSVWEKLPAELEALYRRDHPWDDVKADTTRCFANTASCVIWGDRPEVRIYPQTPAAENAPAAGSISMTAPGNGHDVYQLVVTPTAQMEPVSLRFSKPTGPGDMPPSSLTCRVARCVPVKEVRDKSFPLGPTPDPLVEPTQPEPVAPGQSALFWIEWAPRDGSKPGVYEAEAQVMSGGKPVATVRLKLRRWAFDLPEVPHYRSMVLVSANEIMRLHAGLSEEQAFRLAWDLLSKHRLSGFNLGLWPTPSLKDGKLAIAWTRFDRMLAAAKEYQASALTIGPMFGGGCSQGWQPFKFLGFMPLADEGFDPLYVEFNREVAERLRQADMLDRSYVYPYDEPEPDYMDRIGRLCDLIHQGDPELKCLMTVDPAAAQPLWGKVKAWIIPSSTLQAKVIEQRRAAGDEIWIYNMTAAIEDSPLEHRLYMWRALRIDAAGGLLWNCCWWNKINPWENPTAAPVAVGRQWESLYHYQAGQASLFYPDPAGKGPLVPALRLILIRQGVEDFDILSELVAAWSNTLPRLSDKARREDPVAKARAAFVAPVMLDLTTTATSAARVEALRLIAGNELEVVRQRPFVITYPTRVKGKRVVAGCAEVGVRLTMNGKPVVVDGKGRFEAPVSEEQLAAGLRWSAVRGSARKSWEWVGLR